MENATVSTWYYERLVDPADWETKWWKADDEQDARELASHRDHASDNLKSGDVTGRYRVYVVNNDGTGHSQVFDTDPEYPTPAYDPRNATAVQAVLKRSEAYPQRDRNGWIASGQEVRDLLAGLSVNATAANIMDIEHSARGDMTSFKIVLRVTLSREESGMPVPFALRDKTV
jgi:hypothetical protein